MEQSTATAPFEGYMKNSRGGYDPIELVKPLDKIRDELVRKIVAEAEEVSRVVADFKARTFAEIASFVAVSGQDHGVSWGGEKGNVNLSSYDAELKVVRAMDEYFTVNEQLQVAKHLIDQCIRRWAEGSRAEIRALIDDAFQVDKRGRVNIRRILGLRRLDIQDEQWQQAMKAIGDSLQVAGTKEYIRLYKKDAHGQYQQISLDVAK